MKNGKKRKKKRKEEKKGGPMIQWPVTIMALLGKEKKKRNRKNGLSFFFSFL